MSNKTFRFALFVGVFLLPFVYNFSPQGMEVLRVSYFQRFVEILLVLGIVLGVSFNKISTGVIKLIVFWAIVLVVSSVMGVDFDESFWGNYWRGDGLVTIFHLIGFSILVALYSKKEVFIAIFASSIFVSLFVVAEQLLNILATGKVSAISSFFGHRSILGGFLLVALPLVIYYSKKLFPKYLLLLVAIATLAIWSTLSIVPIIGSLVLLAFIGLSYKTNSDSAALAVLLSIAFLTSMITLGIALGIVSEYKVLGFEGRARIYKNAAAAFTKRPLFGWGVANFGQAFDFISQPLEIVNDVYADNAHAEILDILVSSGLVGLTIYIAIFLKTYKNIFGMKREIRYTLLLTLLVYFLHSQTNVTSIAEDLVFWSLVGIGTQTT